MTAALPVADRRVVARAALTLVAADRRTVVVVTLVSALSSLAGLGGPWLLGRIIDAVAAGGGVGRVDRLALAAVAGAHGGDHAVAQRQRRAQLAQEPVDPGGRIGRVDPRFAWPVAALVNGRLRRRESIGHEIIPRGRIVLCVPTVSAEEAARNEPGTPAMACTMVG